MKTCRVLITTECNLKCTYCCNKIPEVQSSFKMTTWDEFLKMDYDVVNISGGEPMLSFPRLEKLLNELIKKKCRVYLYTNGLITPNEKLNDICHLLDGVNIGCHGDFWKAWEGAKIWKSYLKNVRFHMQDIKVSSTCRNKLKEENLKLVEWKMNECDKTEEDRFII